MKRRMVVEGVSRSARGGRSGTYRRIGLSEPWRARHLLERSPHQPVVGLREGPWYSKQTGVRPHEGVGVGVGAVRGLAAVHFRLISRWKPDWSRAHLPLEDSH